MRLVYRESGEEVKIGDEITSITGCIFIVDSFREPHKPSSEGKISVKSKGDIYSREYYASVIGAEWVEREDRV